ncbi:hypothetical protein Glove_134g210 [Diversispora epigaea]|uniref:F-box domain-containing protein n=1 Tax=Diversispora epigaea TaxID=1348612 RepID=A0A397J3C3_9GLOM|nr:hypothetical protein Glove_134g210 [Diversispora epigaea]
MLIFTSLPNECKTEIFEHLLTDRQTLYRCLLVNRFWCKNIIPSLWREPFRYKIHKVYLIIRTYLLALTADEQSTIIPFNINFEHNQQPLLFEYGSYLEIFNCASFFDAASKLLINQGHKDTEFSYSCQVIVGAITKMLMRTCRNLKSINLSSVIVVPDSRIFESSKYGLSQLVELCLCLENNSPKSLEILNYLSTICHNLSKTFFIVREGNNPLPQNSINSLVNLIMNQHELKNFKLHEAAKSVNRIISSFISQQNSLTTIYFSNVSFDKISNDSLEVFIRCKNIIQIQLYYCKGIKSSQVKILKKSQFILKSLILYQNEINISALIDIWGFNLEYLDLDELNSEIINFITKRCQNLINLTIKGSFNNLDLIFPWIKESQLKIFSLERTKFVGYFFGNEINPIFTELGKNLPNSLNYLKIKGWKLMENVLGQILKVCKLEMLEILLIEPFSEQIKLNHLIDIKEFLKRNRSVKKVEINFHKTENPWTEEEKKIINEIKEELNINIIKNEIYD